MLPPRELQEVLARHGIGARLHRNCSCVHFSLLGPFQARARTCPQGFQICHLAPETNVWAEKEMAWLEGDGGGGDHGNKQKGFSSRMAKATFLLSVRAHVLFCAVT
jgi:hypothetical protein